jgi:hypothetical protein
MPPAAARAALETYIRIMRERHPGVVLVPLSEAEAAEAVASGRQIIFPFARLEEHDALIEKLKCLHRGRNPTAR